MSFQNQESDREAFDRSFELFESQADEHLGDHWDHANNNNTTNNNNNNKNVLNTTFESDPFEFSAMSSTSGYGKGTDDGMSTLFPEDPFEREFSAIATVRVGIHEQVSALYDDVSATEGTVQVEGSIHVKPLGQNNLTTPFCLVCRDLLDQIERLEERSNVCEQISSRMFSKKYKQQQRGGATQQQELHSSDRVLRVTLPEELVAQAKDGFAIANYTCVPTLRPVPILVKSRVGTSGELVRVGFKVRANPSNEFSLTRIMILLAVPPNVDGQSVRMSRQGGLWDSMKRTVSWSVKNLDPGEALEIQTQFLSLDGGAANNSLGNNNSSAAKKERAVGKFPVLVRCDYNKLFSSIEVLGNFDDGISPPIRVKPSSVARVLHRKV